MSDPRAIPGTSVLRPASRRPRRGTAAVAAGAVLAAGMLLSACGLGPGIGGPQVGGDLVDPGDGRTWPDAVRVGVVGVDGAAGAFDYGIQYTEQAQVVDEDLTQHYTLELPEAAEQGVYQVVAYTDDDNDDEIDAGEVVGRTQGSDYLFYAADAGPSAVFFGDGAIEWEEGWNRYDASRETGGEENPYQADSYTDVDLTLD